jgi:hypothetical protein
MIKALPATNRVPGEYRMAPNDEVLNYSTLKDLKNVHDSSMATNESLKQVPSVKRRYCKDQHYHANTCHEVTHYQNAHCIDGAQASGVSTLT